MSLIETKSLFGIAAEPYNSTGRPLLNQSPYLGQISIFDSRNNDVRTLMDWVKRSPECVGVVNKIAGDVATKVLFKPVEKKTGRGRPGKDEGKISVDKAKAFARNNFFRSIIRDSVADAVITGDFFNWKGKISKEQYKEVARKVYAEHGEEYSDLEAKQMFDEDMPGINAIQHVPSTTVTINFNETQITGYWQRVNEFVGTSAPRKWRPDEIIHGVIFPRLNGKVHGFTPMSANKAVISTLGLIKDYAGNYFNGGGAPDMLIAFEQNLESSTRELINQQLEEYKSNMRRGHMVVDGSPVKIEKINEFNKDMEFYKLAIYYTGIIAFSFRMPTSSMGPIIGSLVKQSSGGVDSTEGDYWRNVRALQEYLEDLYNTQLWLPEFGVEMSLDKPYLIDEIKESQNQLFINDGLAKAEAMLNKKGKSLKMETVLRMLGFEESDVEDMTDEQKALLDPFQKNPADRQNSQDNLSLSRGGSTESFRDAKRSQARPEKATVTQVPAK